VKLTLPSFLSLDGVGPARRHRPHLPPHWRLGKGDFVVKDGKQAIRLTPQQGDSPTHNT
jgi:hypothetical protein